jgi:hypothetical protein
MLEVAFKYRAAVDDITADKSLKLRKYELDDDDDSNRNGASV